MSVKTTLKWHQALISDRKTQQRSEQCSRKIKMTFFLLLNVILLLLQNGHGSDETNFDTVSSKAQLVKLDPPGK